jgi:hypothetical protein
MANRTRSKKRNTQRKSKKRNNRSYKKSKKQRGGADFSQAQTQQLLDLGFTEANIQTLAQVFLDNMSGDAAMNLIQQSLGQINNITGQPNTPQEIIDSLNPDNNENDLSEIGDDNSQHNISDDSFDFYPDDDLDNNDNNDNNNLNNNISDISEDSIVLSDQGDTTRDDSRMSIGELDEVEDENGHQNAGRRRTRKGRKGKKSRKMKGRKSRKQRGGMRYGTGVGSNCFDPNFSIYNTPALSLFPYKPN